jgi:hypothetical protein
MENIPSMAGLEPAIQSNKHPCRQRLNGRVMKFTLRPRFARSGGPAHGEVEA